MREGGAVYVVVTRRARRSRAESPGAPDPVSAHKKGPKRAPALLLNQPDDAYIVRLSMERIPTRDPGATQARATRDYSKGQGALQRAECA